MSTTFKKFVFITVSNAGDHNTPTLDSISDIFKSYARLSDIKKSGLSTPFIDVLEIPENFYEFLVNQITLNSGIVDMAKSLVTYEELNAKVLCCTREDLEKYLDTYYGNLKNLLEKLAKNMGDLSSQIILMDNFKKNFLLAKA